jgi:zinc D-Ala-D-Ala carboxypeptidase
MLRTARALAASVALGATLLIIPVASPSPAIGVGPLPKCRLDDILTIPRGYDDWSHTLVDWIFTVGPDYKPPDLVSISRARVTGGGQIRAVAFDDLEAMADAARAHGTPLGNVSSYRSYKTQKALFNSYANGYGFDQAINFSARPGHSEHQLGVTIDFAAAGTSTFVSETSPTGRWLAKNAWKYGWLMSYPKGKQDVVCYRYEPWHYRYFGRDLATKIHDSGLTTREYLWSHYTTVDPKTGQPVSTGSPAPSGTSAGSLPPEVTPPAPESPASEPTTSPPAAEASGVPTLPPASPAARLFGLDPPVAAVLFAVVLVLLGVLAARVLTRRSSTRR